MTEWDPHPSCEISVVVPVYNLEHYIELGLKSLAAQTFDDFEVIVVDDGSTDSSLSVVKRFCSRHASFTALTQPNAGIGAARNTGMERATGRFIAFLDGDDLFAPRALEVMHRAAVETQADLVIADYDIFDELRSWRLSDVSSLFSQAEYDRFDPRLLDSVAVWNKLFRRSVITGAGMKFSHVEVAEDVAFTLSYVHHCEKIVTVHETVCHYRRHAFVGDYRPPQRVTAEFVEDFCEAFEDVRVSAREHLASGRALTRLAGEHVSEPLGSAEAYAEEVLRRETQSLVNLWHHSMWVATPTAVEMFAGRLRKVRAQLSFDAWNALLTRFRVYRLEETIAMHSDLAAIPLVSVVAHHGDDPAKFERLVRSLYAQKFPRFELIVSSAAAEAVPAEHQNRPNIVLLDAEDEGSLYNAAIAASRCDHLVFTGPEFAYQSDGIRALFAAADNKSYDIVTSRVFSTATDSPDRLTRTQSLAFATDDHGFRDEDRIRQRDRVLGNKLVKRSFLEVVDFTFTGDLDADAQRLYRAANFAVVDVAVVCTELRDRVFEHRVLGGLRRDEKRELRQAKGGWRSRSPRRSRGVAQGATGGPAGQKGANGSSG